MFAPRDHDHDHDQVATTSFFEMTLPADDRSPRRARAAVAEHCDTWGLRRVSEDAALIVSELVANAARHAGTGIHLTVRGLTEVLRLEVSDGCTAPLRYPAPTLLAEGGRGLLLVDALASHHGVVGRVDGKTVWAELDAVR